MSLVKIIYFHLSEQEILTEDLLPADAVPGQVQE